MITKETIVDIHVLHRQGTSIRRIAELTGVSRNTVKRYLRDPQASKGYKTRARRPGKLAPYEDYVRKRVADARPDRLAASVLLREIRAKGYDGSERLLRLFVATLYPPPAEEPVQRFETAPGEQMQVDWCVLRRRPRPLSAFVATLGYSRFSFVELVENERFATLRRCHEQAFEAFGGVPGEALYDNMRTVVVERNAFGRGKHRFHAGLLDMATHFGFSPRLCQPYRAQTKGKVERFNRYLRESFYVPLRTQLAAAGLEVDVETGNAALRLWLRDVANARVHATTGVTPVSRLREEREALRPLPVRAVVAPAEAPPTQAPRWPVTPLQRSPASYDALFVEEVA